MKKTKESKRLKIEYEIIMNIRLYLVYSIFYAVATVVPDASRPAKCADEENLRLLGAKRLTTCKSSRCPSGTPHQRIILSKIIENIIERIFK